MPGWLPKLCMMVPGFCLFGLMFMLLAIAIMYQPFFYVVAAVLTVYVFSWTASLAVFATVGAWKMRAGCAVDWHSKLERFRQESTNATETAHIVILPNYKEDESMLWETLQNLGRAPEAKGCMRIVLAMEEREGPEAVSKANRLMKRAKALFLDIIAVYHPPGMPQELAGKSSNTQWAYREAMRYYAVELSHVDPSRIFLTVGDADTMWHPQYFSALAYQGLQMPAHERQWAIWQPPILLLRNLFSVPGATRCGAYGTILFEISGIANQYFGTHLCFSAYSLTLALASHHAINGWDTDVIAEDHHMFAKCYFASLWEARGAAVSSKGEKVAIVPKVKLCPVWLPAVSTLPEEDGWFASNRARFQQAKRHCMGVAELSYVLLQYAHLVRDAGFSRLPIRTHAGILSLAWKMFTVHILNNTHAFAFVAAAVVSLPSLLSWVYGGGLLILLQDVMSRGLAAFASGESWSMVKWALIAIFGPTPPIGLLVSYATYTVINDLHEGRYTPSTNSEKGCNLTAVKSSRRGWREKLWLAFNIQNDYFGMAEVVIVCHGLIPASMACWSLIRRGQKFEYIVAAKPTKKLE
jgi:hypothetical protein